MKPWLCAEAAVTELDVHLLVSREQVGWPDKLLRSAGFTAMASWPGFVEQVYRFPFYRLEAKVDNKVVGLMTLTKIHHPVFGNYLTTAPFASYGGFAYENAQARNAVLDEANRLRKNQDVKYVLVRFDAEDESAPVGWQNHPVYATYLVSLESDPESLFAGFSSNHRNHVRKSQKKGFNIRFGHLDLLDDAYEGLARSMHELGSPYHGKEYLSAMAASLGETLEFAVVYDASGKVVGSGVFIIQGDVVTNLHANILRVYRSDYAGEFLYWSAIEHYGQAGIKTFDLGRSLIGSGNEVFKLKWNPRVRPLSYWYALSPGISMPDLNQKNPKFQLAIAVWKRLPHPLVRFLGPFLIRGLA